jgi:hypothetical protein
MDGKLAALHYIPIPLRNCEAQNLALALEVLEESARDLATSVEMKRINLPMTITVPPLAAEAGDVLL